MSRKNEIRREVISKHKHQTNLDTRSSKCLCSIVSRPRVKTVDYFSKQCTVILTYAKPSRLGKAIHPVCSAATPQLYRGQCEQVGAIEPQERGAVERVVQEPCHRRDSTVPTTYFILVANQCITMVYRLNVIPARTTLTSDPPWLFRISILDFAEIAARSIHRMTTARVVSLFISFLPA